MQASGFGRRSTRTAADAFLTAYGWPPGGLWAAPGRVNVIGEHTDYNNGFVLPMALSYRVICAAAVRGDGRMQVRSLQFPDEVIGIELADLVPGSVTGWSAYPLGVAWALRAAGHALPGADLLLDGDVPLGAGLSSSAAVECAVAMALDNLGGLALDRTSLARTAQRAENEFVRVPTGSMDQMASMRSRAGHLLFLDTRSLEMSYEPFDLSAAGLVLLVIDTRAPHRLVDGAYRQRRRECDWAAEQLGVPSLRDITRAVADSTSWASMLALLRRRAWHVVTENERVLETVACIRRGDLAAVGPLLTASHASLRDDYEVSVGHLDVAVEAALAGGAHGARMTGGGFGGCVIALVDESGSAEVISTVQRAFEVNGFAAPTVFAARPSSGAARIG